MGKSRELLVRDLMEDDIVYIPSPKVKIIKITPLSRLYSTKMQGYLVEMESIDKLWKGSRTEILMAASDTVKTLPRPGWWAQLRKKWAKKRAENLKAGKMANTSILNAYNLMGKELPAFSHKVTGSEIPGSPSYRVGTTGKVFYYGGDK